MTVKIYKLKKNKNKIKLANKDLILLFIFSNALWIFIRCNEDITSPLMSILNSWKHGNIEMSTKN